MVGWSAMLVLNGASCGRRHICVRLSWSNFRFGSFVLVNRGPYNKYLDATVHLRGSLRKDEWESRERKKGKEKASEVYYWVGYHGGQLRFRLTGDPLKNHTEFSLDFSHQRWEIWGLYLSTQLPFLHGWGLPLRVFQSSSYTSRKKFLKHQENLLGREAERFRGPDVSCWLFTGDFCMEFASDFSASAIPSITHANIFHPVIDLVSSLITFSFPWVTES